MTYNECLSNNNNNNNKVNFYKDLSEIHNERKTLQIIFEIFHAKEL